MVELSSSDPSAMAEPDRSQTHRHLSDHLQAVSMSAGQTLKGSGDDPRPLEGYALLLSVYSAAVTGIALVARRRRVIPQLPGAAEFALSALAVQYLSRVLTKDSITSVVRSPMVAFEKPTGDGEVSEEVVGTGIRHALGELITCPFCIAQWTATALVTGRIFAPRLTNGVVSVAALAGTSDYLQLAYDALKQLPSKIGD
jgi:Protein of unknown function (DUF1360)